MTRIPRIYANSKTYHIIFKGIDNQNIFYDDQDRKIFLKYLSITKKEFAYNIYSYCLMDNHVHMVIKSEKEFLSKAMQSLMIRYVHYFNKKYKRIGTLLQARFKSKNVENQRYFLEVCRYVHRNPENAGISKTQDYQWSSYHEYIGKGNIVDKNVLLHYFGNDLNEFINYTMKDNKFEDLEELAEYEIMGKLSDEEVVNIIMNMFKIDNVSEISNFFRNRTKEEFKNDIGRIRKIKGTNKTQIARIIRVSRWVLEKLWDNNNV